jgi:hypothetical protein
LTTAALSAPAPTGSHDSHGLPFTGSDFSRTQPGCTHYPPSKSYCELEPDGAPSRSPRTRRTASSMRTCSRTHASRTMCPPFPETTTCLRDRSGSGQRELAVPRLSLRPPGLATSGPRPATRAPPGGGAASALSEHDGTQTPRAFCKSRMLAPALSRRPSSRGCLRGGRKDRTRARPTLCSTAFHGNERLESAILARPTARGGS